MAPHAEEGEEIFELSQPTWRRDSRVRACSAKMVRMLLRSTTFSSFFRGSDLGGGEVVVEDDQVHVAGIDPGLDLLELPAGEETAGVDRVAALAEGFRHFGAGGAGEEGQFGEGILFGRGRIESDQDRALFAVCERLDFVNRRCLRTKESPNEDAFRWSDSAAGGAVFAS
jgi:hypothetical protein